MELSQLIRTHHPKRDESRRPLHILFVTSEVAPYSKTGGLGDVSASLPLALASLGHHVTILTPRYRHIDPEQLRLSRRHLPIGVCRCVRRWVRRRAPLCGSDRPGVRGELLPVREALSRASVH